MKNIIENHKKTSIILVLIVLILAIGGGIHYHNTHTIKDSSPKTVKKWINGNKYSNKKTVIYVYKNKSDKLNSYVAQKEYRFDGNIININLDNPNIKKLLKETADSDDAQKIYNGAPSILLIYKNKEIKFVDGSTSVLTKDDINKIFNVNVQAEYNKLSKQDEQQKQDEKKSEAKMNEQDNKDQVKQLISSLIDKDNSETVSDKLFINGENNSAYNDIAKKFPDDSKDSSDTTKVQGESKIKSIKKLSNNKYQVIYNAQFTTTKNTIDTDASTSKTTENKSNIQYKAIVIKKGKSFKVDSNKQLKVLSDSTKEI